MGIPRKHVRPLQIYSFIRKTLEMYPDLQYYVIDDVFVITTKDDQTKYTITASANHKINKQKYKIDYYIKPSNSYRTQINRAIQNIIKRIN